MRRRSFLGLGAVLAGGAVVAACSTSERGGPGSDDGSGGRMPDVETIRYGDDPSQLAELTRPEGTSRGVVVVIHGGFWRAEYDLSLGRPLAASLAAEGWTAWNLEYRRVGDGGGWPQTGDDVSAGIDALADVPDLDLSRVVTLGHSAGGHLAVWAAGRAATSRWADVGVPVTAAVSQAGVLDLRGATGLGAGAVTDFLGADPADVPDADPMRLLPLDVPVRCVHGTGDDIVPISQSETFVDAATAAGVDATLTPVDGDHFVVIDPASAAWATTLELLAEL